MCAACKNPTEFMNTVRDGINKEVDAKIRVSALDKALQSMGPDYKEAGGTREVIKRAVVFMDFLAGDIATREQVPE